jgi:U1 small nuclear ribonucleoprotein 70kDa
MTDKLPPQLLALFAPRPPLRYLLPADIAPERRKSTQVSGLASFLHVFDESEDEYTPTDTAEQAKVKRRAAKEARLHKTLQDGIEYCTSPSSLILDNWTSTKT